MQFKTFDIVPHGTKFDFVGKRHIAVTLSLIANAAVILWAVFHGLNFGVDFAGGTEMEVKFQQAVDPAAIRKGVEDLGFKDASVQTYGADSEHTYLIRVGRIALMSQEDVNRVVQAVDQGYDKVFWTIVDSHVTTLVAGLVLMQYGSGPVRGFAVTLIIGLVASMFTSIVVTRAFMDYFTRGDTARLSV